jgi:hypothetical protein
VGVVRIATVRQHSVFTRVRRRVQDACEGVGGLTLLTGPAGAGKTYLAGRLADAVRAADGVTTAWIGGGRGGELPYWPWIQLLRQVGTGDSLRLEAVLSGHDAADDTADIRARYTLYDDVATWLAGCGPLLVVVDDLHFGRRCVAVARSTRRRGAVSHPRGDGRDGTRRRPTTGDEWPAVWPDLARVGEVVPVGPLAVADIDAMLASALDSPVPVGLAARIAHRTGGNAFYVSELARAVAMSGATGADALPPGVRAVVGGRVAERSAACRRVLGAAAVIGRRFPVDLLMAVVDDHPGVVAEALDEAATADLVHTEPVPEFVHEIVRDAVYGGLPLAHRTHWHHAVAAYLAAGPDSDPGDVAFHYRLAGPGQAEQLLRWSERAGVRDLGVLAYEDAARHFTSAAQAAAATGAGPAECGRLRVLAGQAWSAAGRSGEARRAYEAAAADGRAAADGVLLAYAALGLGAGPAGLEVALQDREQIDALRDSLPKLAAAHPLRALVLARLSIALTFTESVAARTALVDEAVDCARLCEDPAALAAALAARCDVIAGPDHSRERLGLASEIIETAVPRRDPVLELIGRRHRLIARLELGDVAGAQADMVAFDQVARALRQPVCAWYPPLWRAMLAELHGDVAGCERELAEVERIGALVASRDAALLAGTLRWCLAADLADADRIRDLFATAGPTDADGPWASVTRTLVCVQVGELAEARVRADGLLDRLRALPRDAEWLSSLTQAAEVVAEVGPRPAAEWLHQTLSPYAGDVVVEGIAAAVRGSVERHLGLLAAALEQRADAARHFSRALDTPTDGWAGGCWSPGPCSTPAAPSATPTCWRRHASCTRRSARHIGSPPSTPCRLRRPRTCGPACSAPTARCGRCASPVPKRPCVTARESATSLSCCASRAGRSRPSNW